MIIKKKPKKNRSVLGNSVPLIWLLWPSRLYRQTSAAQVGGTWSFLGYDAWALCGWKWRQPQKWVKLLLTSGTVYFFSRGVPNFKFHPIPRKRTPPKTNSSHKPSRIHQTPQNGLKNNGIPSKFPHRNALFDPQNGWFQDQTGGTSPSLRSFSPFFMETKKVPQRSGPLGSCAKDLRGRLEEFKAGYLWNMWTGTLKNTHL